MTDYDAGYRPARYDGTRGRQDDRVMSDPYGYDDGRGRQRASLAPSPVPVPVRRSRRARHPLVVLGNALFTVFALLAVVGGGLFVLARGNLEGQGPLEADKVVEIPAHKGVREIADLLEQQGVIDRPLTFAAAAMLSRADLKFGEYQFPRQASVHDVIGILSEGKVLQHQVTVPEGLTSEQIIGRLMGSDVLAGSVSVPKEGTLLPESYRWPRGTPREQVVQRMRQARDRVLQEVWEHREADVPLRSPEELVILASIVEKETGRPDERPRVAAVFVNRLKQHMKLQSDPTIIYGIAGGRGTLGRPITRSEIEQKNDYNTYVIPGLPHGPICNPGRAALEAVARPARTRELYFVADGSGGHTFSETLDQHQKAVEKLRERERASPSH